MYKMSYDAITDERDWNGDLTPQHPSSYYGTGLDGPAAAAQDAVEYVQRLPKRRDGGRRSKKRPTARRLRSSKARKARKVRKARATRRK